MGLKPVHHAKPPQPRGLVGLDLGFCCCGTRFLSAKLACACLWVQSKAYGDAYMYLVCTHCYDDLARANIHCQCSSSMNHIRFLDNPYDCTFL